MSPAIAITIYGAMIMVASLFGGALPNLFAITHRRMQITLSFVGGLMLGIAILHMLPHAIVESGSLDHSMFAMLVGLLFMFFLIRLFHFHQHAPTRDDGGDDGGGGKDDHSACGHDHADPNHDTHGQVHGLSWAGVATGMAVHTLIDGLALGTAVVSDQHHDGVLWGFGVFLAIVLHKPLDALSITSLMKAGGWPASARTLVNVGFSFMCPVGAAIAVFGLQSLSIEQSKWIGLMMGFSAGVFLCISLSDLLPEVQFHRHDRLTLSAALLIGIGVAYGITLLESQSAHEMHHDHSLGTVQQQRDLPADKGQPKR
jgi:zinc and cadmium transporter